MKEAATPRSMEPSVEFEIAWARHTLEQYERSGDTLRAEALRKRIKQLEAQ